MGLGHNLICDEAIDELEIHKLIKRMCDETIGLVPGAGLLSKRSDQ
jgi:hypothetical protein